MTDFDGDILHGGPLTVERIRAAYTGPMPAPPARPVTSREINWAAVHPVLAPTIDRYPGAPILGTPEWVDLDPADPAAVAAVFAAAERWALSQWLGADSLVDASHGVSAALDWSAEARRQQQRTQFYTSNPHLQRRSA